jgi:hypothetical protein
MMYRKKGAEREILTKKIDYGAGAVVLVPVAAALSDSLAEFLLVGISMNGVTD